MKITPNSSLSETRGGFIDRTGIRYGKYTAVRRLGNDHNGHVYWECVCDCGRKRAIRVNNLGIASCKCPTAPKGTQLTLF
jgi:hypothetical protein